jgi:hypothetical protein
MDTCVGWRIKGREPRRSLSLASLTIDPRSRQAQARREASPRACATGAAMHDADRNDSARRGGSGAIADDRPGAGDRSGAAIGPCVETAGGWRRRWRGAAVA